MPRPWWSGCSRPSPSRWWSSDCRSPGSPPRSTWSAEWSICATPSTMPTAMSEPSSGELPLKNEHDIVLGRQAVRRLAQECGFSLVDQTKIVTATSELARNAVIYGGGGTMKWEILENGLKRGLRLSFEDHG